MGLPISSGGGAPAAETIPIGDLSDVPPLPGDATKFLDGTGAFTTPAGTGAPADAQYLTLAVAAGLSAERVLTPGTGLDITDAGAGGAATLDIDLNELGAAAPAIGDKAPFTDVSASNVNANATLEDIIALSAIDFG